MARLDTPIEEISRISKKMLPALKRLGIHTVRDLLFHVPSRYEDFSHIKKIADVAAGEMVTIQGTIASVNTIRTARKKMFLTEIVLEDESGPIKAVWYNQPYLTRIFREGLIISLSGKVSYGRQGICLQNPSYENNVSVSAKREITHEKKPQVFDSIHTGRLTPIYPETYGISSRGLRYFLYTFLELRNTLVDPLPVETRKKRGLVELKNAIRMIHFPRDRKEIEQAERRFAFEDLLMVQLRALGERMRIQENRAPEIPLNVPLLKNFVGCLPFPLTNAQRRSLWEIARDMQRPFPMNRLLEGDVGSGKTVVAAAASLLAVRAGYRVACMAPTEILARQHYETIRSILAPFNISCGLKIGSQKIWDHDADIAIGTHALIQKNVSFENVGLVIVDEQHRFGVGQRATLHKQTFLKQESSAQNTLLIPHFLSMTATPIPRTLALTIYGDLDLSILDEMPRSRKSVETRIVMPQEREDAYACIRGEVKKGRQIFVVCPRIEAGDTSAGRTQQQFLLSEVKTVKEEFRKLSEEIFPDLRVGMLHGKLKSKEKEEIMEKFKEHLIDVLVSTSVVEVGVDIPNATVMMIEGAERFGLSQLHQFRGRVGRGSAQSYCFLFPSEDGMASRRLRAVVDAKNGFALAEQDFKIRGPGDLFGTRQWGISGPLFHALTNPVLVREVREEAGELLKKSPDLRQFPYLAQRLQQFEKMIHPE